MDDPWYGTDPAYDQTYAEITAALPGHRRARARRARHARRDRGAERDGD